VSEVALRVADCLPFTDYLPIADFALLYLSDGSDRQREPSPATTRCSLTACSGLLIITLTCNLSSILGSGGFQTSGKDMFVTIELTVLLRPAEYAVVRLLAPTLFAPTLSPCRWAPAILDEEMELARVHWQQARR
jgi:hypothetical protein